MPMLVIPILPETLQLLNDVTNGLNVKIEAHPTYYVYFGDNAMSDMIISHETYKKLEGPDRIIQLVNFPR